MFKKIVSALLIICMSLMFIGCGSDMVTRNDSGYITHRYEQIGLAEMNEMDPNVEYEVVWGNVVWSIVCSETVIIPIVLVGWYLYEPIGLKSNQQDV